MTTPAADGAAPRDPVADAIRARLSWAPLIYKVYEVDALECPTCKGPMKLYQTKDKETIAVLIHSGMAISFASTEKQFLLGNWKPIKGVKYCGA